MLYHTHSYIIANTTTNSGIRIITNSITTTSINNNTDTHTNTNTKTLILILIRKVVINA